MTFDYLSLDGWLHAIRTDPEAAETHATYLRQQASVYGPSVPLYMVNSLDLYERALRQVAHLPQEATTTQTQSSPEYPDEQEWRALMQADPRTAREKKYALEARAAQWGAYNAPIPLQMSLDAYRAAEQSLEQT